MKAIRTLGGEQLCAEYFTPCAHHADAMHFDCKRCGRLFCSTCEGGSESLAPREGFSTEDLCDPCWGDVFGAVADEASP